MAAVIAIVAVAGVAALFALRPRPRLRDRANPEPLATIDARAFVVTDCNPLLDTAKWTSYTSGQYGFTVATRLTGQLTLLNAHGISKRMPLIGRVRQWTISWRQPGTSA